MLSSSPIVSKEYNDVAICNEYSNKENRNKPIITNEYQLNSYINLKNNNNKEVYQVEQTPTIPSPSLYLEYDQQKYKYYENNAINLSKKLLSDDYLLNHIEIFS